MGGGGVESDSSMRRLNTDLSAYLINMAIRLIRMKRVLKDTGSIYLHCDPTASHYLKLVLDVIFGSDCFQNEIIWRYRRWPAKQERFQRMHDVVFWYSKNAKVKRAWNQLYEELAASTQRTWGDKQQVADFSTGRRKPSQTEQKSPGAPMTDVWDISIIAPIAKERLGYPTQKPIALLERIITASSNKGDLVLDPFCGCGTTVEAAERLGRQWIGIDISTFATGLIRERVVRNVATLKKSMIEMHGVPVDIQMAKDLAKRDKFEFEKWVCGAIGAYGMYHSPGTRGADGGVDGILEFYPFLYSKRPKKEYAIIQVKGGKVSTDSVRALYQTVKDTGAKAGVIVCFEKYMATVENNRSRETFTDDSDMSPYPVIQGFSVERLLSNKRLNLPQYQKRADAGSPNIRRIEL